MTLFNSTRDQILVKGYEFLCSAINIGKNVSKNITKILSSKHSAKILDHVKKSATYALKVASKTAEQTSDFIGNKIVVKITRVSKTFRKINSRTNAEEFLRERLIPSELRHKIVDDLRLNKYSY